MTVKKVNCLPVTIKIAFKNIQMEMFRKVFRAYMRAKLMFAAAVWSHRLRGHRSAGEGPQAVTRSMGAEVKGEATSYGIIQAAAREKGEGDMMTAYKFLKGSDELLPN